MLLAILRTTTMSKQVAKFVFFAWIAISALVCLSALPFGAESFACFLLQFPLTAALFIAFSRVSALQPQPKQRQLDFALDQGDEVPRRRQLQHPEAITPDAHQDHDSDTDVDLSRNTGTPAATLNAAASPQHTPAVAKPSAPMSELDRFLHANNLSMQQVRETSARKPRSAGRRAAQRTPARSVAFTPDTRRADLHSTLGSAISRGGASTSRGPSLPPTPIDDSAMHGTLDASFAESTGIQGGHIVPATPLPAGRLAGPESAKHFGSAQWGDESDTMDMYGPPQVGTANGYQPMSAGGSTGRRFGGRRRR